MKQRPMPPSSVMEVDLYGGFEPADDLLDWVRETIIDPDGDVHNPDHSHLENADVRFLWSSAPCTSKGRRVLGMAEKPMFRCNQWQKARQELQIRNWFGKIPDFIITLDAYFCDSCEDVDFLALVEHELYHCAQAKDEFGAPRFNQVTGQPIFEIRGHDVEEFVGVVKRYGVTSEELADMVIAAAEGPEVSKLNIARACGTCALKSA